MSTLSSICFSQKAVNKSILKEVNGEVFIVTKGAVNIKLGLVTVYFLTEKQYKIASDSNCSDYHYSFNVNYNDSVANYEQNMHDYKFNLSLYQDAIAHMKNFIDAHPKDFGNNINEAGVEFIHNMEKIGEPYKEKAEHYKEMALQDYLVSKKAERYSVKCFVERMKQEIINDKTNSDGKFSVRLKNQKYWVCAHSTRKVSDDSEEYYWAFEYKPNGKSLFLSNDNLK